MLEKPFYAMLDMPRTRKLESHLKANRLKKRAFLEKIVDELPKVSKL